MVGVETSEHSAGFGVQGPDQGYVLKLAESFGEPLSLGPRERQADVMAGCCAVALRRAALFGRAPVMHDLRLALELFGFLAPAPNDQIAGRAPLFEGASGHHGYHVKLHLAALVPEKTLRSTPAAVAAARATNWRTPLALR